MRSPAWRPTGFGILLVLVLAASFVAGDAAADPRVAGMAWTAIAAALVVGLVWPALSTAGARARVVAAPEDVYVGDSAALHLELRSWPGPVEIRVFWSDAADPGPWRRAESPGTIRVELNCDRRGVRDSVELEVRSSSPLSIAQATRRGLIELAQPLHVAPRPIATQWRPPPHDLRSLEQSASRPSSAGDVVRSVRPYVPGDASHLVHWPTSARAGALLVRELEPPSDLRVAVVLALGGSERDDLLAGQASGLVRAALALGGSVVLCTSDGAGPRRVEVTGTQLLDRSLAAAGPGPAATPPAGALVVTVGP